MQQGGKVGECAVLDRAVRTQNQKPRCIAWLRRGERNEIFGKIVLVDIGAPEVTLYRFAACGWSSVAGSSDGGFALS